MDETTANDEARGRSRQEFRLPPDMLARVKRQAKRKGQGLSAYVRLALSERLEADEREEAAASRPQE